MKYIDNFEKIQTKYMQAWSLENHDRPIMNVTAWKQRTKPIKVPDNVEARWTDADFVSRNSRYIVENQYYAGESFPTVFPNLGPDIFAALFGADIQFGETTSWSKHNIHNETDYSKLKFLRGEKWHKKIIELTTSIVDESKGDYQVGITDIHAGMDALVALRGPAELCTDLYDCPQLIKPLPMKMFETFKEFYSQLYDITTKYLKGSSTWMKAYSTDRFYVTSCDLICMISKDDMKEFVLDELLAEAKWLDKNIFHLDGPGALRHLDTILQIKEINGVQWVPGDGALPCAKWPQVLQKIQAAGKVLQIHVNNSDELRLLHEIIKPEGVMLDAYVSSAEEADYMVKTATDLWKKA